jgi:branched-chain amino acid transport system permease protein
MIRLAETFGKALGRLRGIHPLTPWALAFVVLLPLPLVTTNLYQVHLIDVICIMIILSVGLNIVKGFAGQVTVGHIGLYAIGAYSSAVLALNFGFPFWLALPAATLITGLAGVVVGIPSFRLEGAYLALATLGMSESVRIFITVTQYLGSSNGIGSIPAPAIGGFAFDTQLKYYYLLLPVTLLAIYVSFSILGSSVGRAFKALREDPVSAAAAGVNVRRYKLLAFVISALYAGSAGSLYAHLTPGYIHPNNFTIIEMVTLLLMVVLGGIGHVWGGVIGAVIVTVVYDFTREYYYYQMLIFGGVIVFTVLFMPKGIGGIIDRYLVTKRFLALREGKAAHAA